MNPVYEIRVEETNEHIRDFIGDAYLDLCLSTWTRLKGKKVIAVEKQIENGLVNDNPKSNFLEVEELFYYIRDVVEEHHWQNSRLYGSAIASFDMRNVERLREIKNNIVLGRELFAMQSVENDGRGVSAVRQVAHEIMRGDLEGAQAIAHTDWDKIRNYEDIAQFLKQNKIAKEDW